MQSAVRVTAQSTHKRSTSSAAHPTFLICTMYANKNKSNTNTPNKNLKQSIYRSGHALRVSRRLGLPNFKTIVNCQPYAPAAFTPRKYSWYSFLLEAESNPGPLCGREYYVNNSIGNRSRDLPACSAVSQLTAPPRVLSSPNTVRM